jgi:hypothetical protein
VARIHITRLNPEHSPLKEVGSKQEAEGIKPFVFTIACFQLERAYENPNLKRPVSSFGFSDRFAFTRFLLHVVPGDVPNT